MQARIAVATVSLSQEIRRSITTAAESGAHGVQFDLRREIDMIRFGESARKQLKKTLSERQLSLASTAFPLRTAIAAPEYMDERLAGIRSALEFSASLQVKTMSLPIGTIPDAESETYQNLFLPILNDIAAIGNHVGVVPCFLPTGDSAEAVLKLASDVRSGPIGIDADLAAWVMHGQSPIDQLRELHSLIMSVTARDAVRGLDGGGREVSLGQGQIDWDEIAALLDEMDYRGWLIVDRTSGESRRQEIIAGVASLRRLFFLDRPPK